MTDKRRIWFPGASYHITSRGNRRNDIFKDVVFVNRKLGQLLIEF
jgi:putative transposase